MKVIKYPFNPKRNEPD